jgi:polysaccharide export outer membrane protein
MTTSPSRPSRARAISRCVTILWLIQLFASPNIAVGQSQRDGTARTWLAARHDLDSLAAVADQQATNASLAESDRVRSSSTASAIRTRLREGDFRIGDRLVLSVRGEPALTDTFTVRDSIMLKLPNIPEIPLRGVLRSEVEGRLMESIATYYRQPTVRVTTLVRIGVLGQVLRPGYYQIAADAPLSDAIMAAGGPTPMASPDNTIVRHGSQTLWNAREVRDQLASGATLAQLEIHSGDDIVMEEGTHRDWMTLTQAGAGVTAAFFSIWYMAHH